jgi:multisubunit Na+/H+ antiporter MnhE subunit
MLHAAAMLIGLFALGLLAFGRGVTLEALMLAGAGALVCVAFAARFGGISRSPFSAPHMLALFAARAGAVVRGALTTIRAAIAADVTLKPALVRVRTRGAEPFAKTVLADLIGAAPGALVVEADADGALVHVTDEDSVDSGDLGVLEARVLSFLGERT